MLCVNSRRCLTASSAVSVDSPLTVDKKIPERDARGFFLLGVGYYC